VDVRLCGRARSNRPPPADRCRPRAIVADRSSTLIGVSSTCSRSARMISLLISPLSGRSVATPWPQYQRRTRNVGTQTCEDLGLPVKREMIVELPDQDMRKQARADLARDRDPAPPSGVGEGILSNVGCLFRLPQGQLRLIGGMCPRSSTSSPPS
jgi:hypothetical protein